MALGLLRWYGEFKSSTGILYKIEIYDEQWATTSSEFSCGSDGFKLKYEGEGEDMYHPIKSSSLTFEAISPSNGATFDTFIAAVRSGYQGQFKVRVLRDGSQFWRGTLLADVGNFEDEYYPRAATLRAVCGLSLLKKVDFNKSVWTTETEQKTLTDFNMIIKQLLKNYTNTVDWFAGTDTFLWTSVDWYEDTMPTPAGNIDPLRYSASYTRAFVKESDAQEEFKTAYEALEQICRIWGARIYQSNGYWRFVQIGQHENTSIYYRRYGWSPSAQLGSGTIDLRKDVGTAYDIRDAGGQEEYYPKLKKVTAEYGEITKNGLYGAKQELDDYTNNATMESSLIDIGYINNSTGSQVSVEQHIQKWWNDGPVPTITNDNGWIVYMLKCGSYYWDGTQWTTTQSVHMENIGSVYNGWAAPFHNTKQYDTLTFQTPAPPAAGVLKYYATKFIGTVGNQTQLSNDDKYSVTITENGTVTSNNQTITSKIYYTIDGEMIETMKFIAENTTEEANEKIENGLLLFGDAPYYAEQRWGRIRVSANLTTWDQTTDGQWQAHGSGTITKITALLCEQMLARQNEFIRKPLKTLILINQETLDFHNTLDFGSDIYMFVGYTFNANMDEYQCELCHMYSDPTYITNSDGTQSANVNYQLTW